MTDFPFTNLDRITQAVAVNWIASIIGKPYEARNVKAKIRHHIRSHFGEHSLTRKRSGDAWMLVTHDFFIWAQDETEHIICWEN